MVASTRKIKFMVRAPLSAPAHLPVIVLQVQGGDFARGITCWNGDDGTALRPFHRVPDSGDSQQQVPGLLRRWHPKVPGCCSQAFNSHPAYIPRSPVSWQSTLIRWHSIDLHFPGSFPQLEVGEAPPKSWR